MKKILAFDFGASSGRGLLGSYSGGKIETREVSRFSNDPVMLSGTLYWDTPRHFYEIKSCIGKTAHTEHIDAIGIDTWGVDFGLIDKNGMLLSNPVHYRDKRNSESLCDEVFSIISREELYKASGIQHIAFNTIYQLYYLHKYRPEIIALTDKFLMIPDLFAFLLTGKRACELTDASTTGLLDPYTHDWNYPLIDRLGFSRSIFPEILRPGEAYGFISGDISDELGCGEIPVVPVCTHDTASAVLSVPAEKSDFAYISCGTWSLLGTELNKPLISDEGMRYNYTNEVGFRGNIRFLRNIMGLWLIQESRRQFMREGDEVTFSQLEKEALENESFMSFIDCDDPSFVPAGNIPERIREYCRKTNQTVPAKRGEIMMCIYRSLAMKYRYNIEALEKICGRHFDAIHMVGGGIKDTLLMLLTASACGKTVIAGPVEATAYGNIAAALISLGEIESLSMARSVIRNSTEISRLEPENTNAWDEAFIQYKKIIYGGKRK